MPYVFEETQVGEGRPASEFPSLPSEVYEETFAQAFEENPIAAMSRAKSLMDDYRSGGKRLDLETATQRLKERGMEGDIRVSEAGITEQALNTLMYRKGVERRRQEVFGQAKGGFGQGAARLGLALGTSLVDPVNIAMAFIPVVGEARYTSMLAKAGSTLGRAGVRAGVGAAEGVAGAALIEPIIAGSRRFEQADYDMSDSLLNVAFGGVFGAGLHSVGGAVSDGVRYHSSTAPAWKGLEGVKPDEIPLVRNLRQEIERGMDARDIARVTETWSPEAKRAVEADIPKVTPAESAHQALPPQVRENALKQAIIQAVSGEPVNVQPIVNSYREEIVGYTTAKGSTYLVDPDGRTTRDKAARPEHPGDSGPQPKSDATYYVTEREANLLGEFQTQGGKRSIGQMSDGRIGVRYEEGKNAGKFERRTVVAPRREPEVGLIPVEVWKGGKRVHFGNKITEVRRTRGTAQSIQGRETVDPTDNVVKAIEHAEKILSRETDTGTPTADALKMATEEATLAQSDLKAVADRLGLEAEDAELRDVLEAAANSERWAKAAELATICLTRGG